MKNILALFCGTLFGIGLSLSGMTDTQKVIGFLNVFGNWIPDLIFVMGGAVITTLLSFSIILRRKSPLLDKKFYLPSKQKLDRKLIIGAALFGIGWGIYGYCPGPAIAALAYVQPVTAVFLLAMTAGMAFTNILNNNSCEPNDK